MQWSIAGGLVAATLLGASASGQPTPPPAEPAPRVVNLTPDSAPGWVPSEALEQAAREAALAYLAARDAGQAADAYGRLAELNRADQSEAAFAEALRAFNAKAGAVKERRITTVTWTKDPDDAPAPGVYAAIDLVSRFANIDRHCGYLMLWQSPQGGPFQVMREEATYMDNAAAAADGAGAMWAALSRACPNYAPGLAHLPSGPLPESPDGSTGYASVAAALSALRSKPGVVMSEANGWTIASDDAAHTIWSFSPPSYPAYPAVVKREVVEKDGRTMIKMSIHCEAAKEACDELVRTFNDMNGRAVGR